VTRKEADQSKTLQDWGFKELEPILIHVQEANQEQTQFDEISLPEMCLSSRFDDLHALLSGEKSFAYLTFVSLTARPPEPKFVENLKNLDTPWENLFPKNFPWQLTYSAFVLNSCTQQYSNEDPSDAWLVAFGDKHHRAIVDLFDWLSKVNDGASDWVYSINYIVAILDKFLLQGEDCFLLVF
jgi:hypothetical protein